MAYLDSILNFGIPAILILITLGFLYTKVIQPWVLPLLAKLWEWMKGNKEEGSPATTKREIIYE
jgi:hypothetical protein